MIIVTGGAGLIGSATVWALNQRGREDIIIVDEVDHDEKEHNVANLKYDQMIGIADFRKQLLAGEFDSMGIEAIIHLGACSSTTEQNWDYLLDNNVEYTKDMIRWCQSNNARCIYASSAATYGNGELGYDDDHKLFDSLAPLNLYGKSKLLVDIWARDGGFLDSAVGLRYFNVFGPNEWHKEAMMSVVAKKYPEIIAGKPMTLFKSYEKDYTDGGQKRDFVYVKDAVRATLFFLDHKEFGGIYNVGTGVARTWLDVARAMFAASDTLEKIEFIEMPTNLKKQYQYFTQANVKKLEATGFDIATNYMLEDAITEYVQEHLAPHQHLK
ncbi:MAG: ADP-glyceromanno-heptose 6-epimerase [bacterium]|nr:ADP-glyceromanno-heptose 6-epimerase [bacterium]